jgi:acylphosphatase
MPTIHIQISGKVQGVYYRASAREEAQKLKLTGWVKNMSNGDVEATATGNEESLAKFVEWCREGPPGANVENIIVNKLDETAFEEFLIVRGR